MGPDLLKIEYLKKSSSFPGIFIGPGPRRNLGRPINTLIQIEVRTSRF